MNPYESLGGEAFWRTAVAQRAPTEISGLWKPRFPIGAADPVATYGSCFSQHMGKALRSRGYTWLIAEPCPKVSPQLAAEYNYDVFSARTGNIYTTSLLDQWLSWTDEESGSPAESWLAPAGGCIDPFRPVIEPGGFASPEEMMRSRGQAIRCLRQSVRESRYFVFTMGLTESWRNREQNCEYPACPGTVAGHFDPQRHQFVSQDFKAVRTALAAALRKLRLINPEIRVLLSVSPVPLTATASGQHVLVATMHSKSILRAVAGWAAEKYRWVDYFPLYEIINSPAFGGMFFEPNKRTVKPEGIEFVMNMFFDSVANKDLAAIAEDRRQHPAKMPLAEPDDGEDDHCEETLLDAFGKTQ